jgi:riboflavin kinase/FMN adenylyltransferase
VHIFNFCDNIYGRTLKVELVKYLREERKFSSAEELKKQIAEDCKIAKRVLKEVNFGKK